MVARACLLALAACGSSAKAVDDAATRPPPHADATGGDAGSAGATGELVVRVEWKKVPVALRASPGRTPCGPRAAQVAPTTMWGIPDVVVLVDGAPPPAEARVVLADCALAPRALVAGALVVESAVDYPMKLTIAKWGTTAKLGSLAAATPRTIQLPIAGHAVALALDANAVYQLAVDPAGAGDTAWIVTGPAVVTDATGQVTLAKLAGGPHTVTAWLPARGGQPARLVTKPVTVAAGGTTELVVDLGTQ